MANVNPKVIEAAKEKLIALSEKWVEGVCRGQAWDLSGKKCVDDHSYCHSWVSAAFDNKCRGGHYGDAYTKDAKDFLVLSCHSKRRSKGICSVEAHEAIIKWMATDEFPLTKFILNRDDEHSLLNGGVIILCGPGGATEAQALWICKVLRYAVEGSKALDTWLELTKAGVNPLLAVYVGGAFRTIKGASFTYTGQEGHSSVFYGFKNSVALLTGDINQEATETKDVFNTGKYTRKEAPFNSFSKPIEKDDGWGGKVKGVGADRADFVQRVLDFQKELEKELPQPGVVAKVVERLVKPKRPDKNTVFLEMDL